MLMLLEPMAWQHIMVARGENALNFWQVLKRWLHHTCDDDIEEDTGRKVV